MTEPRKLNWRKLSAAALTVYWIALAIVTHVPRMPTPIRVRHGDKISHYVAYALLAILISWAWSTRRRYVPWGIVVAWSTAVIYGGIDELTQVPIPGRFGDWYDWCADSMGALTGIALFWCTYAFWSAITRSAGSARATSEVER